MDESSEAAVGRTGYGSAADMPTFRELDNQIQQGQILSSILAPALGGQLKDLRRELDRMISVVDGFYDLLGDRNWVFHDSLRLDDMEALLTEHSSDATTAEAALVAWYQEPDRLEFMVRRLWANQTLRAHIPLIEGALADYRAERYAATVLVLLSAMDGAVNGMDPSNRKGMHARDASEMQAWDSVVGHHKGLAAIQETFRKPFKALSTEPVFEVYRNGIVHGALTGYGNIIVATKAWNMLFAVKDMIDSLDALEAEAKKPPEPTLEEAMQEARGVLRARELAESFRPYEFAADDQRFASEPVVQAAVQFMDAWQKRNYRAMAELAAWGVKPREAKSHYAEHLLTEYSLAKVRRRGAGVGEIEGRGHVNGIDRLVRLAWMWTGNDGNVALLGQPGEWRLSAWGQPLVLPKE